jgi:hypothetical protein
MRRATITIMLRLEHSNQQRSTVRVEIALCQVSTRGEWPWHSQRPSAKHVRNDGSAAVRPLIDR